MSDEEKTVHEFPYLDNFVLAERKGPHGFYHVRMKHGELPVYLKDHMFTNLTEVQSAVTQAVGLRDKLKGK